MICMPVPRISYEKICIGNERFKDMNIYIIELYEYHGSRVNMF